MVDNQESKRHHYTPEFLMDKWVVKNTLGHKHLNAHYWDCYKSRMCCKSDKGPKSYCYQQHLFTLEFPHSEGQDVIEQKFFGKIDAQGALVRDILLQSEGAITNLTANQRSDWARLLLSLDVRLPNNIFKLKNEGAEFIRQQLDNDLDVLAAMSQEGVDCLPAEYVEKHLGSLKDKSLSSVQALVDNPVVGKILVNAYWYVIHFDVGAESLVLSDRPLIRINAYDRPGAAWFLPLTPSIIFIAVNHPNNFNFLLRVSQRELSKKVNISSVSQASKWVFVKEGGQRSWLEKYMKPNNIGNC